LHLAINKIKTRKDQKIEELKKTREIEINSEKGLWKKKKFSTV